MMEKTGSKALSRFMILAFVGLAFAFGATMLMTSQEGSLFADLSGY